MNITIKDLQASINSAFSLNPLPRKIKITSKAAEYLDSLPSPFIEKPEELPEDAIVGQFTGIPIEIDDTIENEYYELIY